MLYVLKFAENFFCFSYEFLSGDYLWLELFDDGMFRPRGVYFMHVCISSAGLPLRVISLVGSELLIHPYIRTLELCVLLDGSSKHRYKFVVFSLDLEIWKSVTILISRI